MSSSLVPISLRDPFWDDPHFSSSRTDFDDMRRKMMREAKDFWTGIDEDDFMDMRRVGGGGDASRYISRLSENPATAMPAWFVPERYYKRDDDFPVSSSSSPLLGGRGRDSQVLRVREDDDKLEITLDVHNFKPDELKVRTTPDGTVFIEGKHEERTNPSASDALTAGSSSAVSRNYNSVLQQFSRQISLPASCDPLRVVSNLSRDGVLIVTAPKKAAAAASAGGGAYSSGVASSARPSSFESAAPNAASYLSSRKYTPRTAATTGTTVGDAPSYRRRTTETSSYSKPDPTTTNSSSSTSKTTSSSRTSSDTGNGRTVPITR